MAAATDAPVDLYIAAYADPDAARADWDAIKQHAQKAEIRAAVGQTLPLNSSGIVAMFEPQWADAIDKALSSASNVTKEQVDGDSADEVKAAAGKNPPGYDRVAPNPARPCSD